MPDCIFCRIANGEMEAKRVHEDSLVVAIEDIKPAAPTHLLVIPRQHLRNARELANRELVAHIFDVAHAVANGSGIGETGYRLVFNVGRDGGQTVDHVHLHVIGGRPMAWPPG